MDNQCHMEVAEFSYYLSVAVMCVTSTSKDMLQIEEPIWFFPPLSSMQFMAFQPSFFLNHFRPHPGNPKVVGHDKKWVVTLRVCL